MERTRDASATRARLLDAAAGVMRRGGPRALTLEAVAAEAGVSKGGLLYHFASKPALLEALFERWLVAFEATIEAEPSGTPGSFTRAYVTASDIVERPAASAAVEMGLFSALVTDPARLDQARARYAAWQQRLGADGIDPADATVARLAADGLWLADLLGLAPPTEALREAVVARIRALAAPHGVADGPSG